MPRLSALRLSALRDLAEQLRFAPKPRMLEQLKRAVDLVPDIEADRNYPEDWVVFRITNFRPEMKNPSTIVGKALRSELSAFVERVSDAGAVAIADLPGDSVDVEALGARWTVTRKTIERYRRRGLVAHRVRDEAGRTRLLFTPDAYQWFEAENAAALGRAGQFTRIPEEEIERMLRVAARAQRRFGWTRGETARCIAEKFQRAQETVRLLLIRTENAADESYVDPADTLSLRRRLVIVAAARRGIQTAEIARRINRSPTSVRRLLAETRAELLRSFALPIDAHGDRDWRPGDAERALIETVTPVRVLSEFVEAAQSDPPPDSDDEHLVASAHRAVLCCAGSIVTEMPRYQPSPRAIDVAEAMLRWAALLRARLVRQQRRTILQAIESALESSITSLPPRQSRTCHLVGMRAAATAAAEFLPARGGRFAASVVVAVNRDIRALPFAKAARTSEARQRASSPGVTLADWTTSVAGWQRWLDLPRHLEHRFDALDPEQRRVIQLRFGFAGDPPCTTTQIADTMSLHPLRIARLQQTALRTLYALGRPTDRDRIAAPIDAPTREGRPR